MGDIDQSGALDSDDQQSGTRVPDTTPRARRVLVALTTLLVVLIVAGLSLAARPGDLAIDEPITEDGYYALAVARSIADGSGVTIVSDQGNPSLGIIENRHGVGVLAGGW